MASAMPMFPMYLSAQATWDGARPTEVFLQHQDAIQDEIGVQAGSKSRDSLLRLVDLLEGSGEDEYGEVGPTQHAFKSAYRLIDSAEKQIVANTTGSPCVDSLGGIRVTWKLGDREVRLICPATNNDAVYLYHQSEAEHLVSREVTAKLLADKLLWLLSGVSSL